MRTIVYYVAISVDGFISGEDNDISGFLHYDDVIEKYQDDLKTYDTTIMGRHTYEFGYQYGLKPGQPAYPHMKHYIFSNSLSFENPHEQVQVLPPNIQHIKDLRNQSGSDIYLCGGGILAGWLLKHKQIGKLILKLNPFIQGSGVRLFEDVDAIYRLQLVQKESFPGGLQLLEYDISYD